MDSFDIVEKLKHGGCLSKEELTFIKNEAFNPSEGVDLDNVIRAFGLAFPATDENVQLVEGYLKSQDDLIRASAIRVLCNESYWGLVDSYIDFLISAVQDEDLYTFSETHIVAFGAIGEYLHVTKDKKVFSQVLSLFNQNLLKYQEDLDQIFLSGRLENIYFTLDYGVRGRQALLDKIRREMKFPDDIDQELIRKVKKIIG